jgi:putative membrane protein
MLSDDDRRRIREAVEAVERTTRGEIVPMLVPAAARYREAEHRAGLIVAVLVLAAMLAWHAGGAWLALHPGWILLATVVGYLLGAAFGRRPAAVRLLVPADRMAFKVRLKAEAAFHEHGLHRTREATGVLILVSMLERRVQILADRGINERVDPGTWEAIADGVARTMAHGSPADALCEAVAACGDVLARQLPAPPDNRNELRDDLLM